MHVAQRRPWRALHIFDSTLGSLQRDPKFGFSAFRALAYAFHGRGGNVESLTLPTRPQTVAGQSALVLDDAEAAPVLARLRSVSRQQHAPAPPAGVSASDVRVSVQNGSGRGGAASAALDALRRSGFAVQPPPTNADRSDYGVTEVQYVAGAQGAQAKAQLVLAYLGGAGKVVAVDSTSTGADVTLVIGRDFIEVTPPLTSPPTTRRPAGTTPATARPPAASTGSSGGANGALPAVGCSGI